MRKIFLTLLSVVVAAALIGCGDHHHEHVPVPANPSGGNAVGFSNASLSGSYVFAVNGVTTKSSFAVTGVFSADSNGNIISGTRDTVDDSGNQTFDEPITGTYFVNGDGRGQAILNGGSGQAIYRFVLSSPTAGKLFQDGTTSDRVLFDAIGTIQQQSPAFAAPTGTYILRLDGEDPGLFVYGAIGAATFNADGSLTGTIDENDAGAFIPQAAATGTISLTGTRGTATLNTISSITGGNHFIVYFVSPTHLELLSADRNFFLHGHADLQTGVSGSTAAFFGNELFNISGTDSSGNAVQEIGRLSLDGAGNVAGFADYNDGGNLATATPLSGSDSVASTGRWQISLNYSSINVSTLGLVGWQISPQQSEVLTTNSDLLETGTLRLQSPSLTTASITGPYAEDFSGFDNSNGDFESTGNLDADGLGSLSGALDSQTDSSGLDLDALTTGSYSIDPATERGTGFIGGLPVSIYPVNANTLFLFSTNSNSLYLGTMLKQQP